MKERFQNPVVGDDVRLRLFAYNSNNRSDFYAVSKVEVYYLDPTGTSAENPDGRRLVETLTVVTHEETGLYSVTTTLAKEKYVIGDYLDVWYVQVDANEQATTVENSFRIYPNLWFTMPVPVIHDFSFSFRPNKIRKGSKRYLIIDIEPNVPKATDLGRYYENLAIVSPLTISMVQTCGDCLPQEQDLRTVADKVPVDLRERCTGYYLLDATDLDEGIYDVWFEMQLGESYFVSDKSQIQIF